MAEAERRFVEDRARMFDLEQTQRLFELSGVAPSERDAAWAEAFFPTVWYASVEVGPTFRGPDFFPYLRLHLPRPGERFDSNSLGNVARGVVEQGLGVAVFASPEATEPVYVFPMGVLGSLLEYDSWLGDPVDLEDIARAERNAQAKNVPLADGIEQLPMQDGQKIFTASPASLFLPSYTARALYRHLRDGWKLEEPRVMLLLNPAGTPARNLVINKKMSEFPDQATAGRHGRMLLWYLPPKRSLLMMPESWTQESMRPLREYFPGK